MSPLCFELRAVCQTWSELRAVSQTAFNLKRAFSQISNMARPRKQQDEDLKELLSIFTNKNCVLESSSLIKNLFRDFLVNLWGKTQISKIIFWKWTPSSSGILFRLWDIVEKENQQSGNERATDNSGQGTILGWFKPSWFYILVGFWVYGT